MNVLFLFDSRTTKLYNSCIKKMFRKKILRKKRKAWCEFLQRKKTPRFLSIIIDDLTEL